MNDNVVGHFLSGILTGFILVFMAISLGSCLAKDTCLDNDIPRRWNSSGNICQEYIEGEWEVVMEENKMIYNEGAQRLYE